MQIILKCFHQSQTFKNCLNEYFENTFIYFIRWFKMTEHRYLSSLLEMYNGQKFAGIIKQNLSKMGLSKILKPQVSKLPEPGTSLDNPVHISESSDEGISMPMDNVEVKTWLIIKLLLSHKLNSLLNQKIFLNICLL